MRIMATAPATERPGTAGTLLLVALVLLLAWQLAYWTWAFIAPPAVRSASATAAGSVDLAAIARLFGASAPASGASASGLRLKGVVAPTPGVAASAIFAATGRDNSVFVGGEVVPGVTLAEVHPDHVIVSRGGVRERVDLDAPKSVARAAPGGPSRAAGFHLNVAHPAPNQFSLSRHELDQALRDPNQLNYLGQIGMPAGGGVRMEAAPPGSLAAKLGLQPGDIIRKLNGQAVASPGDLARLYQQFGTLTQVDAEIQRGTGTVRLKYEIQ